MTTPELLEDGTVTVSHVALQSVSSNAPDIHDTVNNLPQVLLRGATQVDKTDRYRELEELLRSHRWTSEKERSDVMHCTWSDVLQQMHTAQMRHYGAGQRCKTRSLSGMINHDYENLTALLDLVQGEREGIVLRAALFVAFRSLGELFNSAESLKILRCLENVPYLTSQADMAQIKLMGNKGEGHAAVRNLVTALEQFLLVWIKMYLKFKKPSRAFRAIMQRSIPMDEILENLDRVDYATKELALIASRINHAEILTLIEMVSKVDIMNQNFNATFGQQSYITDPSFLLQRDLRNAVTANDTAKLKRDSKRWIQFAEEEMKEDDGEGFIQNLFTLFRMIRFDGENSEAPRESINVLLGLIAKSDDIVRQCFERALKRYLKDKMESSDSRSQEKWQCVTESILNLYPAMIIPISGDPGNEVKDWNGLNALHLAAQSCCPKIVERLTRCIHEHHSDPVIRESVLLSKSRYGESALMIAIWNRDKESVRYLIEAEPKLLDQRRNTRTLGTNALHDAILALESPDTLHPLADASEILDMIVNRRSSLLVESCDAFYILGRFKFEGGPPYALCKITREVLQAETHSTKLMAALESLESQLKISIFRKLPERDIPSALYLQRSKLIELDLADFKFTGPSTRLNDFGGFVNNFATKDQDFVAFEDILCSVCLPQFSNSVSSVQITEQIDKLFKTLGTGPDRFGVKQIMKLIVRGDFNRGLDDEHISEWVSRFKIEELDWQKLDLDLDRFPEDSSLRKLTLYSRGNWGTLYYWTSEDGILKFENLESVEIHIIIDPGANRAEREARQRKFAKLESRINERLGAYTKVNVTVKPMEYSGDGKPVSVKRPDYVERFFAAFTELTDFYQSIDDLPRIKVAILDTGIDSMHDDVRSNIKGGASFVRAQGGNSVLPWFTALDAHGTQMASLIVNVNPFCDLYIYRVCSWPWDINATAAVNAIEAAIEDGVDIINASWTFDKDIPAVKKALRKATTETFDPPRAPLLVFASKSDDVFAGSVYPADYENVISVGAATSRGRVGSESNKSADLIVLGENMPAAHPAYAVDVKELVSGSSVATALATGIASLLLMVARRQEMGAVRALEGRWEAFKERRKMLEAFARMRPLMDSSLPFVDPQRFLDAIEIITQNHSRRDELKSYL